MAKLYRDEATNEYFTESELDGGVVTLRIASEGSEFLRQNGVSEGGEIPVDLLGVLAENGWLTEDVEADSWSEDFDESVTNTSETGAAPGDQRAVYDEPLPSVKLEPRPFVEPEDAVALSDEARASTAGAGQPGTRSGYTQADKANANAISHPEDAAFVGGVWFWLLILIVVAILVWGAFEIF